MIWSLYLEIDILYPLTAGLMQTPPKTPRPEGQQGHTPEQKARIEFNKLQVFCIYHFCFTSSLDILYAWLVV